MTREPRAERLAVIEVTVAHLDLVHLGARHRRLALSRADGWRPVWLSP